MNITEVSKGITQISVNVENILFEGLWDIPKGVNLNSYIVKGESTAIIDGVCGWDGVPETLFQLLEKIDVDVKSIKYVILNHLEPDHSGWVEDLMKIHKDFQIIASEKGAEIFEAFFAKDMNVRRVKDGDTLDLGGGKKLSFAMIPHVHWPDTMVTFEENSGTLFTCDAFGSFGMFEHAFDDDYSDEELKTFEHETIRYYANIVAAFSQFVVKAIEKCGGLNIKVIAPGHGLMWRKRVPKIINDYLEYATCQKGGTREEITLIWGSMYGMTEKAVNAAREELEKSGVKFHEHRVPQCSWGDILTSIWTSRGVILGMPTYEYKMFPPMAAVLEEIGKKKVQGRHAFRFGSYGWSGGAQKELDEIATRTKMAWNFLPPTEFKGQPQECDTESIKSRVRELVDLVKGEKLDPRDN